MKTCRCCGRRYSLVEWYSLPTLTDVSGNRFFEDGCGGLLRYANCPRCESTHAEPQVRLKEVCRG